MKRFFILYMLVLITIITGCTTTSKFALDIPTNDSYIREVSDIDMKLRVIDEKNLREEFIYFDGRQDIPAAETIREYFTKSLNNIFSDIGFSNIGRNDYEFEFTIVDALVEAKSGYLVPVKVLFETKLVIKDLSSNTIIFDDTYKNEGIEKVFAGSMAASKAQELFTDTLSNHLDDIISSINFKELFKKSERSEVVSNIEPIRTSEDSVESDTVRTDLPIVTVFDFAYEGVSEMEANFLIDFLGGALFDSGNYRIIDRAQRESILSEIQFSLSGCTDESCQLEAGKLLAADYMIIGSLGKIGSRFVINAKLIDIELGETVLSARDIYPHVDAMLDGCDELAVQLSVAN